MGDLLGEYGLFLLKTVTMVVAIVVVVGSVVALSGRARFKEEGNIEVKYLNDQFDCFKETLQAEVLDKHELKVIKKSEKEKHKKEDAEKKKLANKEPPSSADQATEDRRKRIFVLDFDGDIKASQAEALGQEISAILTLATKQDEILVRLESPGGVVHGYGLAASQLDRIKQREIPLVVAVDKVAASGGYMMACIADRILAAPFAIVGSVGVLAQLPNFHKLLKKHDVDFDVMTAGEYKRTLTMFGENNETGRKKFMEELEDTHELFKDHVSSNRPVVDIAQVATGEHWYGKRAIALNLVDELITSDEYLAVQAESADIYRISYEIKKPLVERLGIGVQAALQRSFEKVWQAQYQRFMG